MPPTISEFFNHLHSPPDVSPLFSPWIFLLSSHDNFSHFLRCFCQIDKYVIITGIINNICLFSILPLFRLFIIHYWYVKLKMVVLFSIFILIKNLIIIVIVIFINYRVFISSLCFTINIIITVNGYNSLMNVITNVAVLDFNLKQVVKK